jgi:nucleoside-triphosphatase THEP1
MSVVIFSNPVRSGKTTVLQQWCNKQKNIAGILMPDINGIRNIRDIRSKETFIIECEDPQNTNESLVNIGRFYFYVQAFEKANAILLAEAKKPYDWLVVDEAGRLELDGKGFYPALNEIISKGNYKNLLLVVRESLCLQAIEFFKITDYRVIRQLSGL